MIAIPKPFSWPLPFSLPSSLTLTRIHTQLSVAREGLSKLAASASCKRAMKARDKGFYGFKSSPRLALGVYAETNGRRPERTGAYSVENGGIVRMVETTLFETREP